MAEDVGHLPDVLRTGSLVLRRHQVEDAEAIASAIAESMDELRPWMPWVSEDALDPEYQRKRLADDAPRWGRHGHEATYVIEPAGSPRLLGLCGIQDRGTRDARELGYWLRTSATGRGHATAAARVLTETALTLPGVRRVEIRCDASNGRSAGVAERCGYRFDRTEPYEPQAPGQTGTLMVWVYETAD